VGQTYGIKIGVGEPTHTPPPNPHGHMELSWAQEPWLTWPCLCVSAMGLTHKLLRGAGHLGATCHMFTCRSHTYLHEPHVACATRRACGSPCGPFTQATCQLEAIHTCHPHETGHGVMGHAWGANRCPTLRSPHAPMHAWSCMCLDSAMQGGSHGPSSLITYGITHGAFSVMCVASAWTRKGRWCDWWCL